MLILSVLTRGLTNSSSKYHALAVLLSLTALVPKREKSWYNEEVEDQKCNPKYFDCYEGDGCNPYYEECDLSELYED